MLVTAAEQFAVRRMDPDGRFTTLAQDPRLLWPDSMAEGPDGAIYVTASHIPEMKAWQGRASARRSCSASIPTPARETASMTTGDRLRRQPPSAA